jgi:hypothetical protein
MIFSKELLTWRIMAGVHKEGGRTSKASRLDKTTGSRAQDALPRQDACCTNLEIDEEDDWRITPKGIRTRVITGAPSLDPPLAFLP